MSKFLEDSKFFWTEYHSGKMNIIMHLVSFSFLFYGLTVKSVALVLTGLFVFDEMGHAYNYFFVHNRDPKFGLRMHVCIVNRTWHPIPAISEIRN